MVWGTYYVTWSFQENFFDFSRGWLDIDWSSRRICQWNGTQRLGDRWTTPFWNRERTWNDPFMPFSSSLIDCYVFMFTCFISEVAFPSRNRCYPKFEHLSGMYRNVSELIIHELGSQEFDSGGYGISIIFDKGGGDGILESLSRKSHCWFYIRFKNPLFNSMIFPAMHLHLVRGGSSSPVLMTPEDMTSFLSWFTIPMNTIVISIIIHSDIGVMFMCQHNYNPYSSLFIWILNP